MLPMFHDVSGLQFDQRAKRFQFEELGIREHLEIATEIGIVSSADDDRTLYKEITLLK